VSRVARHLFRLDRGSAFSPRLKRTSQSSERRLGFPSLGRCSCFGTRNTTETPEVGTFQAAEKAPQEGPRGAKRPAVPCWQPGTLVRGGSGVRVHGAGYEVPRRTGDVPSPANIGRGSRYDHENGQDIQTLNCPGKAARTALMAPVTRTNSAATRKRSRALIVPSVACRTQEEGRFRYKPCSRVTFK